MNKNKYLFIILIIIIILCTLGIAYGAFFYTNTTGDNKINTGTISFSYTEPNNLVDITVTDSITNEEGKLLEDFFEFKVEAKATGKVDLGYYIYITPEEDNTFSPVDINVYLSKVTSPSNEISSEEEVTSPKLISNCTRFNIDTLKKDDTANNYLVYSDILSLNNTTKTIYYRLRIWPSAITNILKENTTTGNTQTSTVTGKTFKMKLNVYGKDGLKEIK